MTEFVMHPSGAFRVDTIVVNDISGVSTAEGDITFEDDITAVLARDTPDIRGNGGYNYSKLRNYLLNLSSSRTNQETNAGSVTVGTFTTQDNGYKGGAYSPTQNRIYFAPYDASDEVNWHYIDCSDGSVNVYVHATGITTNNAFRGAVYSPTQDRIYLVPYGISNEADWYYIDCSDGSVLPYTHGFGTDIPQNAFYGGVYSPTQDRIYFVPYGISDEADWYYIDCSNDSLNDFTHGFGTSITNNAFVGGVYSPTQDRIYLCSYHVSNLETWYYIDCTDGSVVGYTHGFGTTITNRAFSGAVYSPTQDRIYFVPFFISDETNWYYIDCTDNTAGEVTVVEFSHGTGLTTDIAFFGGAYNPVMNRIELLAYGIGNEATWYYIDCNDGSVVPYTHGFGTAIAEFAFEGGVYSPTQNRVYFSPFEISNSSPWYFIKNKHAESGELAVSTLTGGGIFNHSI